jgi:hypothetical protein
MINFTALEPNSVKRDSLMEDISEVISYLANRITAKSLVAMPVNTEHYYQTAKKLAVLQAMLMYSHEPSRSKLRMIERIFHLQANPGHPMLGDSITGDTIRRREFKAYAGTVFNDFD